MKYTDLITKKITDPEDAEKTLDVEMTVGQYLEYKMKASLILQLKRLNK